MGRVLPHTEVKIVDVKTGKTVPRGENGELCTRGYLVMQSYYNNPKATAETIDAKGWLRTGDLATMDEDGYVRITGRIKEMIIRGGENIYPREIEEFLHTCPAIADVQVVGVPDAKFGEQVMAWIILRKGHELTAGGGEEILQGRNRRFQDPAPGQVRRFLPHHDQRQGTEVPHARDVRRGDESRRYGKRAGRHGVGG